MSENIDVMDVEVRKLQSVQMYAMTKISKCNVIQDVPITSKYPKTDYTYSRLSKDRVELAPGQVAVPNMSRPSLGRVTRTAAGDATHELYESSLNQGLHRRWNNVDRYETLVDSDYDSDGHSRLNNYPTHKEHWWITSLLITVITTITSITTSIKNKLLRRDPDMRYPYYSTNTAAYRSSTYTKETTWVSSVGEAVKKRKWWFLLPLLLLLPLLYWYLYGVPIPIVYYNNDKVTIIERPVKFELTDDLLRKIVLHVKDNLSIEPPPPQVIERIIETNTFDTSIIDHQQGLIDKLNTEIDTLKDQLAKNDNLDEKIAFLSSKQSRDMLIEAFGLEKKDGTPVSSDDIKAWLKKETFSKDDMVAKLAAVQKSAAVDVNKIGDIVKEELKNIQAGASVIAPTVERIVNTDTNCNCDESIIKIVREAIAIYDADKTGLVDYALESAGGQVISTRCSESYQTGTAVYSLFGIPLWYPSNSPRVALTPGSTPGDCWAFQGFPGYLVIQLYSRIHVTGFTMEHTPKQLTPHGQIESAPKKFTVWGLQDEMDREPVQFGTFEYRNDSTSLQFFPVTERPVASPLHPPGHQFVELRIESNHGNPLYTCLYRFRVHGDPVGDFDYYGTSPDR